MPRFVILEHDFPTLHWDLMLEEAAALATWRLPEPPGPSKTTLLAERIGEHRLAYLDYEGPVSGNRGTVKRWDAGTYEIHSRGVEDDLTHLELNGGRWRGCLFISRSRDKGQLIFEERS